MKKSLIVTTLLLLGASSSLLASSGGTSTKPLTGSYPIVLNHGFIGWGDTDGNGVVTVLDYWGGMDSYLRSQGATVFTPQVSAVNSSAQRSSQLKEKVLYYLASTGAAKAHIVSHSQGGIDARYMVSNLGMGGKVASISTMNTPHRGTALADIALAVVPDWLEPFFGAIVNALISVFYGGESQNIVASLGTMTTETMANFNAQTPNVSGVRYYSWGSYMTWADPIQHPIMSIPNPVLAIGGALKGQGASNDGIVPASSMQWGEWKGNASWSWYVSGIDHMQVINALHSGQTWFDVEGHFLKIAKNAKAGQ